MKLIHTMSHGKQNRKVIFLISGWRTRLWMYRITAKILGRNGFYCITYAYDNSVLSPDTSKTVENITLIANEIAERLNKLKEEGYQDFSIFGTSLGSLIALMVANKSPEISKIILNTVGSDIAESIWSWDKVNPYFKKELLEQNFTLEKLQRVWKSITPRNNIDNLKGKKILVYLSKKDRIIPYYLGTELIGEFKKKQYDYHVVENDFLSHTMTGGFNLLNAGQYLKFLKKK